MKEGSIVIVTMGRSGHQGHLPDSISCSEWIDHIFDHPVLDTAWWWHDVGSDHRQEWNYEANPALTLSFLTNLFEDPSGLIGRFTRAQIDQGLNYLVSGSCSNYFFVLLNVDLPLQDRLRCLAALSSLYEKLMAPLYGNDLGHLQFGPEPDHPTFACYMFWDVIPLYGGMDHPDRDPINEAVLKVFEKTLALKSEACLESVLHGLGHWHHDLPEKAEAIVRRFLKDRRDISKALRSYAKAAARGCVQ